MRNWEDLKKKKRNRKIKKETFMESDLYALYLKILIIDKRDARLWWWYLEKSMFAGNVFIFFPAVAYCYYYYYYYIETIGAPDLCGAKGPADLFKKWGKTKFQLKRFSVFAGVVAKKKNEEENKIKSKNIDLWDFFFYTVWIILLNVRRRIHVYIYI